MENPAFAVTEEKDAKTDCDDGSLQNHQRTHLSPISEPAPFNSNNQQKSKALDTQTPEELDSTDFPDKWDSDTAGGQTKWSWSLRLSRVLSTGRHLNVEPVILLHMMALLITALVLNDLTLDRACRINLAYDPVICAQLAARNVSADNKEEEAAVQSFVASIGVWRFAIEYAIPIFLVLLLGSWSDMYGRKFPLMLPMFGHLVKVGGLILSLYFPNWDAVTVTLLVLVPTALTGSFPIFTMAYHSVIVDTTPEKYRTIRFGFANACQTFGVSLGTVLGGNLFSKTSLGFLGVFVVSGGIEVVNLGLTWVLVQNAKGKCRFDGDEIDPTTTTRDALKGMLNLSHMSEALRTTLRSRPNHGRLKLLILLAVLFCGSAPYYGESSVIYLFLRLKFGWGAGEYGFFGMYQTIAGGVGVLISMGLLSWWFELEDCVVGLLGCVSQISSCLVYVFTTTTTIYVAPVIDILNGAMVVAARAMVSKSVSLAEQGKILSFMAGLDSINPVLSNMAYNGLYKATLTWLPGAFFLLSATLATPPAAVFAFFSCRLIGKRKTESVITEPIDPRSAVSATTAPERPNDVT